MDTNRFKQLAKKHFNNQLTEEELKEFLSLLEDQEEAFFEAVDNDIVPQHSVPFNSEAAFEKLTRDERFHAPVRKLIPYRWIAAACAVLVVCAFFYFNQQKPGNEIQKTALQGKKPAVAKDDIEAAIRLADGTNLTLNDIGEKETSYHGVKLSKISADLYKVNIDHQHLSTKLPYHEFSTGKGISYALLLPDGSKVDLNSGTVLRLDPNFNVTNRNCELTGEAYFDVQKNPGMAFRVKTRDYDVKVLGTQFNVKSYPKSKYSQTALVEGKVHISNSEKEVNLLPGDQVSADKGVLGNKSTANLRDVLAWKEGYFRFTDASIEDIMSDIMNWYAIENIEYQHKSTERFTGSIRRTRSLSDLLAGIEKISNLRFEIKEGRVIVRK